MKDICVFFATGYEEIEALTVVDILRRGGLSVKMVSITGEEYVISSHQVTVKMDALFEDIDFDQVEMIVLPGGMPGTKNLEACESLMNLLKDRVAQNKMIAAICAAPTVFGHAGFLKGKKACCYPDMEDGLFGAEVSYNEVEVDGNVITSRGMGTAIPFGLKLVALLQGQASADALGAKIVYRQ